MKIHLNTFCLALLCTAIIAHAAPVTGWELIFDGDSDSSLTDGSESTASPVIDDAHKSCIAANFSTTTLADGQSIILTGSVSFSGALADNQFRFGLFDGDNPVAAGDGTGYVGFYAEAPASSTSAVISANAQGVNTDHPFSTETPALDLATMSNPGVTPAANTSLSFSLKLTRSGANMDIVASITDGNTYSSSATVTSTTAVPATFTYDSVAFLVGGTTSGAWNNVDATFSNIDVTVQGAVNPDTDGDGLPDSYEQTIIDADPGDAVVGLEDVMGTGAAPAVTDFDGDGADDAEEYAEGTNPLDEDTDDDGFHDGAETNDGTFNSYDPVTHTGDTGTDPLDEDSDNDGLLDGVERKTGTFVDASDTGTDPLDPDSDGDGFLDGFEVTNGSDPTDETDPPDTTIEVGPRLFGVEFNRNDALGSPSQSLFRIIAGSTTQGANGSSYTKAIGGKQVTVSQPGSVNLEFRGANTDSTRAIPGGDTSMAYLVSDFIATREGAVDLTITGLAAGDYVFRSYHLDSFTGSGLGFAQGSTPTTSNVIEARIGGVVKAVVQPTALGSDGLGTTFIDDDQIPALSFAFTHDGSDSLFIELRATQSNGSDSFLLLNGFELFQAEP